MMLPILLAGGPKDGVVWYVDSEPAWMPVKFANEEDPGLPGCCLMYRRRLFHLPNGEIILVGYYNCGDDPTWAALIPDHLERMQISCADDLKKLMPTPPVKRRIALNENPPSDSLHQGDALTMIEDCIRRGLLPP